MKPIASTYRCCGLAVLALMGLCAGACGAEELDWTHWRGPYQNGTSDEKDLPATWALGGENDLWTYNLSGRGTPVVFGEKVYVLGYRGEGPELQEVLACLDAATGKELWSHAFSDFLSDIIYQRYAIGSPTVDPETGNVYALTSPGIFVCFSGDGRLLWRHSLMEEMGRMTFPNGRSGGPLLKGRLVIIHSLTSNWGAQGPAQDRFYAFDKATGAPVWSSSPGVRPKDNSYSTPVFAKANGREVFYCGTGCGNIVCVDVATGDPLWRYQFTMGGINSSLLLYGSDQLIAVHNKENVDSSEIGRMIALTRNQTPTPVKDGTPLLDKSAEIWRNTEIGVYSSSPALVGDRIYLTDEIGELLAIDARTGKVAWKQKLGIEQLHASVLYGDGKLYVPIKDGSFSIVKPGDQGAEILSQVKLAGECNGAPSACHGRIYVFTTGKLYCFGKVRKAEARLIPPPRPAVGAVARILVEPADVLLRPGGTIKVELDGVTATGEVVALPVGAVASWAPFVPATAKVQAKLAADFTGPATLTARSEAKPSAGMFEVTVKIGDAEAKGYLRGRILPDLPLSEDFESTALAATSEAEPGVKFAYPPLPWIGARFKWEVRELNGSKVLAKTIDNRLFQRALTFIGHPDMSGYTIAADVMSEGNKRKMSEVGVICQHYAVILKGNAQELEVNSNLECLRVAVPFTWSPNQWYRLKARVDLAADGSGVVRAKAWKRGDPEPEAWTSEVKHRNAHVSGSPGLFGFSPTDMRAYVDNIAVVPNGK